MKTFFAVLAVVAAPFVTAHCKQHAHTIQDVFNLRLAPDTFPDLISNGAS